jgi:transcriptional regulator with XRE-family HTH domain
MSELMPVDDLDNFTAALYHPAAPDGRTTIVDVSQVAVQLTEYRRASGLAQAAVAGAMDWSVSKMQRIENERSRPTGSEVTALLVHYGVTDEDERRELASKASANRKQGWPNPYHGLVAPAHARYLEYEAAAAEGIWQHDSVIVPEFMQTAAFADVHEAMFRPDDAAETREILAQLRRQRAAYLLGKYGPPLRVIIDEGLLWRPEGGPSVPPEEQYTQLSKILKGLQRLNTAVIGLPPDSQLNPSITVQIVPFRTGFRALSRTSCSILNIPRHSPVVYAYNHPDDGILIPKDSQEGDRYKRDFDELAENIPDPSQTGGMLDVLLDDVASGKPRRGL